MSKPPYRVPSMSEIEAIPHNGFNVVSTFSGCGGSCLGYRMAGFKVLWANEFIPIAQQNYKANHPNGILDTRDIREVTANDILSAVGLKQGEIDVFDGSPPCASFSTQGTRTKHWGNAKEYSNTVQRVDDLFFEYARILNGLQPKVFIAENVSGLVEGAAKGYFKMILKALKDCGYRVEARLINAALLGVPQFRERIIFIGVRNDINKAPVFPMPLPYEYTVHEAIKHNNSHFVTNLRDLHLPSVKRLWDACNSTPTKRHPVRVSRRIVQPNKPSPTISTVPSDIFFWEEPRTFSIEEAKRISSFPDDFKLLGTYKQQYERIGRSVPPIMMSHIARVVRDEILTK